MTVNWDGHFSAFFEQHAPWKLPELPWITQEFAGLEESYWLSLAKRFNVEPEIELEPLHHSSGPSARQRVIRIYARYAPQKLANVDETLQLMSEEGPGYVFNLLEGKWGPEPRLHELTYKERALIMYATYRKLDRVDKIDSLLSMYAGMEETLIRRLVNELGPEPAAAEAGDPRDPRQRLRRIFTRYEPSLVNKIELVMSRYAGKQITMFATMQRRYGREPSENEVREFLFRAEEERLRKEREEADRRAAAQARDESARSAARVHQSLLLEETLTFIMPEKPLPGDAVRPAPLVKCRNHLAFGDAVSQDALTTMTQDIFRAYDKALVSAARRLVATRFGQLNEATEWLAFLDCCYTNAMPLTSTPKLRTIVSLLEMKFGTALEEVWIAGGVEEFLRGIDRHSETEWAVYLTMAHGKVTEDELSVRNRLRAHYLHYNPGVPVPEVDRILLTFSNNATNLYEALSRHYGPEPPPLPVDIERVFRILARHAPEKLSMIDVVIEAHTHIGDSAEAVALRVARTYGAEPGENEARLEALVELEVERRFSAVFAGEMRMREVLIRRRAAACKALNEAAAVAAATGAALSGSIALQRASRLSEVDEDAMRALEEQLRLAPDDAETVRHLDTEIVVQLREAQLFRRHARDLAQDEEKQRTKIAEEESLGCKAILDLFSAALDLWDQDANVSLSEALLRDVIFDEAMSPYESWHARMLREERELMLWLGERLLWRRKWADDGEKLRRANEQFLRDEAAKHEQQRIRDAADLAKPSTSLHHQERMNALYRQLNAQAMRVLEFSVEVQHHRRREELGRQPTHIGVTRAPHRNCVFHQPNFVKVAAADHDQAAGAASTEQRYMNELMASVGATIDVDGRVVQTEEDWQLFFRRQLREYLTTLLNNHDRGRVRQVDQLLQQYAGRESELVSALEQQFDVNHWRVQSLTERIRLYYQQMAPTRIEEMDVVMTKFTGREDALWQYLTSRYGPVPSLQTDEMRAYLKDRIVRFLALRAPHLLTSCDAILAQCEGNGDNVFRRLASEFGPEDRDVTKEAIARKLFTFYQRRGLRDALPFVWVITERFAGRERLLNALLKEKFNDILDHYEPYVEGDDVERQRDELQEKIRHAEEERASSVALIGKPRAESDAASAEPPTENS